MTLDGSTSTQLAAFDPPLAEAVVLVLNRHGIATTVEPTSSDEVEIRVPVDRRVEAMALLASRMEEIHDLVARSGTVTATPLPLEDRTEESDEDGPPIVLDRLRRMSLGLVVLLAPLLVISLAGVNLPIGYALALFVVGLVAVVYWRNRSER